MDPEETTVYPAEQTPRINGILETALYVADLDRAERFYRDVLALRQIGKDPDRHVFFRLGSGVLLLFRADRTRQAGTLPSHGADGEIHVCFLVSPADYEAWMRRIQGHKIAIQREVAWPQGRSFFFRDPDGNLLELADADIWPE
jgi:catechol 2,3-dioxygenase-like lactoylglutathione lyase family enzyme